jgi:8-amino-7-oxononanoate synthase
MIWYAAVDFHPENIMQTIAVFALKGGVGKSSLTIFLADFLSSIFDQGVLVVDLDPQQSTTIALLGEDRLVGFHCVIMSPEAFIRKPSRWLQAISTYSATYSGAPNFAFDLCVRKVGPEDKAGLDLRRWAVCYNGSETVRPGTLEQFASSFADCGFRAEAFFPGYGLAEATLMVATRPRGRPPVCLRVNRDLIEQGIVSSSATAEACQTREYMSCGVADGSFELRIVDADSRMPLPEDRIGEIWLKGPSITEGYWKNPAATAAAFGHSLPEEEGPYLRTGDLGFLHNGELFITGRLKDLIIIRGRNYFPEDIEATVERSHDAFRPGCGAVFSVEGEEEERLIIVHEIRRAWYDADLEEVSSAARKAVGEEHEIAACQILLVQQGEIVKTTSGKIARGSCRQRFLQNAFHVLHFDNLGEIPDGAGKKDPPVDVSREKKALLDDMVQHLAQDLRIATRRIPQDRPLMTLGLDSLQVEGFLSYLQATYGLEIPSSLILEGSSLLDLAEQLAHHRGGTGSGSAPAKPPRSFMAWFERRRHDHLHSQALAARNRSCFFRPFGNNDGITATVNGRHLIMLGSNNYLGLTADPRVREAAAEAARAYGPSMTGSRLLNGSTDLHRRLEEELARFVGREDALVFTTGYQAIVGMITGVLNSEATLLLDEKSHACAIDGARIARCHVSYFKHNQPDDLRRKLAGGVDGPTMVLVDGVYSVEGDYSCLPDIHELCREFGAWLAIDDAHGLGVAGETGRGVEEHFGMPGAADLLAGTFSKSLASIGGWVAGNADTVDWIRFHGRTMLFSAAMPPPALAAALKALEIVRTEPALVRQAKHNGMFWRDGLKQLGARVIASDTPIVPIYVGDAETCLNLANALFQAGVYVNPFIYPAVQEGQAMLRSSVTARHTEKHLTEALRIFRDAATLYGVL